jgi:hypothetical protein
VERDEAVGAPKGYASSGSRESPVTITVSVMGGLEPDGRGYKAEGIRLPEVKQLASSTVGQDRTALAIANVVTDRFAKHHRISRRGFSCGDI